MRAYFLIAILIIPLHKAEAQEKRNIDEQEFSVQSVLDSLQIVHGFPGATAAFILDDGDASVLSTGYDDIEQELKMTPESRMLSGSTGKSFVAALVLDLSLRQRFSLHTPIKKWIGDRSWFSKLPNGDKLTLQMLLRHQSGLTDHIHDKDFISTMRNGMNEQGPAYYLTPEEIVELVINKEPLFPAGEGYHYSDTNYILVGIVIEEITGEDYYNLLQKRLLDPLQLQKTSPADHRNLEGLASGYIKNEIPFDLPQKVTKGGRLVYHPVTEWTGGGLITNSLDLARWAKMLYEGKALKQDYLDELLDSVPKDATEQARYESEVRYGLGVTIYKTSLGYAYGHQGWTPGYLSIFAYYPQFGVSVGMQVNATGTYELESYVEEIAKTVLDLKSGSVKQNH